MRALPLICLIGFVGLAIAPANAEIVRCVDSNGKSVIQDTPCPGARQPQAAQENAQAPSTPGSRKSRSSFDSYKILPGAEQPVTEQQIQQASKPGAPAENYLLQLGAFQNFADAATLAARLGLIGVNTGVESINLPEKGRWYRVRVGPYSNMAEISRLRQTLAQNGIEASLVKAQETPVQSGRQDGRDLFAPRSPGLLAAASAAPQAVVRQPAPDPLAPPDPLDPSQTTSHRASPLDRAVMGGISGAVIGALVGFFILVRALVKKFKGPAAAGAMAAYRGRPQAIKIGAALLLGCAALLVYFLFLRTMTVDDYLNDYQGRLEKLQECGGVPDVTKNRECMNAYTAQRMFMLR